MRTQVAIIGAGPAGLLLGHLLKAEGIDCIVLERQTPDYVLGRIRAGVLEQITVGLMARLGLDARLKAEGLVEEGFNLADGERLIRIDVANLTGKTVVVYGQTEITRDLMDAAPDRGLPVIYGAEDVALHAIESDAPYVTFRRTARTSGSMRASSPDATASTALRARRSRPAPRASSNGSIRSAGWASWPTCRRATMN